MWWPVMEAYRDGLLTRSETQLHRAVCSDVNERVLQALDRYHAAFPQDQVVHTCPPEARSNIECLNVRHGNFRQLAWHLLL